ncbi:amine oxidase [Rhizopogon vinicolor AM-OR11-026]|uniref:Amine oxidase n=1 Tax=Rhizopogon vinicolor AM-OR11-026 TaxID=1314800 RepID=A0A1B7MMY6_9AGAM|nr:amine oxidase [Rhizopogon vinicolor AM-OR11-026]
MRQVHFAILLGFVALTNALPNHQNDGRSTKDAKVLILGGGVAGVIAARTLHEQGMDDFLIVEARGELGGRMQNIEFGAPGEQYTIELGPNWIQGTQTGDGPANPILTLARKYNLKNQFNDLDGSITTYDYNGFKNYTDLLDTSVDQFDQYIAVAAERIKTQQVDLNLQSAYGIIGATPKNPYEAACQYYQVDWVREYAQSPDQNSWIMSAWNNNFTFNTDMGGFSDTNNLCIDPRGFKTIIQAEAAEFLQSSQVSLNSTVTSIEYSSNGATVTLADGSSLSSDYVLCTFSVGVLQYGDVAFEPALPAWKVEAIQNMVMATYTKIFLQFTEKFWFDTQMAIYADKQRGRYPIWQSLDVVDFLPGSGIVFVTVTGDFSLRIESMEDSDVQNEVMEVLRAMYPNTTVPDPVAFLFKRWNADPLFRGSYSNWPASFVPGHAENLRATVNQRLWFAGEATSFKYYGFLHGAYYEGLHAGEEIAKCIAGGSCAGLQHLDDVVDASPYPFTSITP